MNNLITAVKSAFENKNELLTANKCGCYYCLKIFDPKEIHNYTYEDRKTKESKTALCPYCNTDTVIPENDICTITTELLQEIKNYWL